MAEAPTYKHGEMDIKANKASFHAFILMSKWGSLTVASGLLFFVLWFCTAAGFLAAAISAIIVAVLGYLLLREKPKSAGR
jgi:sugar phosphate permease